MFPLSLPTTAYCIISRQPKLTSADLCASPAENASPGPHLLNEMNMCATNTAETSLEGQNRRLAGTLRFFEEWSLMGSWLSLSEVKYWIGSWDTKAQPEPLLHSLSQLQLSTLDKPSWHKKPPRATFSASVSQRVITFDKLLTFCSLRGWEKGYHILSLPIWFAHTAPN